MKNYPIYLLLAFWHLTVLASPFPAGFEAFDPAISPDGDGWIQSIRVTQPSPRCIIDKDTEVSFEAEGMEEAVALCWRYPTEKSEYPWGKDIVVARIEIRPNGLTKFAFPASQFPNGPITLRILAKNDKGERDRFELQLYNLAGEWWNMGIPKETPPQAEGMKLHFEDDFEEELSISATGEGTLYTSHTPYGRDFSGWEFADFESPSNPFEQVDSFLRIRASKQEGEEAVTGLISSARKDGSGLFFRIPYYAECRFIAQSAPGTWPAFWLLTRNSLLNRIKDSQNRSMAEELDVVEAYGGVGPGHPNHPGYSIATHFWFQRDKTGKQKPSIKTRVRMYEIGSRSYWSTTFHTYGVKVTHDDTIYYLDNIEVHRHPTGEVAQMDAQYFLINLAIGGASRWSIDLERYGNETDMYVDWVRIFR